MGSITGVILTPLKVIEGLAGNVMHAIKASDESFLGFGEAYFSTVNFAKVKGWKRHNSMTLNLVVVSGAIKFVMFDDRPGSNTYHQFQEVTLSLSNYMRLTVPPGIWMAFSGLTAETNLLLNIASIPHDPSEADSLPLDNQLIPFGDF